jgi:hypothetical protein
MRHLKKPSPAMFVACLSLFVALSGVTYAATGGNFILGNPNSATSQTSLSAPIATKALQVTNTSTAAGASGIGITVGTNRSPLVVNSTAGKATNLNADKLDSLDSTVFGRLIALKMGAHGGGAPLVAGNNYYLAPSFTPSASGRCLVTITTQLYFGSSDPGAPYYRAAVKRGGASPINDGFYAHYFRPYSDVSDDLTRSAVFDVKAGEPTQFGAFLGGVAGDWVGDTQATHVSYLCTTLGNLASAVAPTRASPTSAQEIP